MTEQTGLWRATYTPGNWVVLGGPTVLVVIQPAPARASQMINGLWDVVVQAESIEDMTAELAKYRVNEMPSFGAFFWADGAMKSLVRGKIKAVDIATGKIVADGEGIQTWSEIGLGGVRQVRVDMEPINQDELLQLPLVVGAVSASAIVLDASEGAIVRSPQQPQPASGEVPDEAATEQPEAEPQRSEPDSQAPDADTDHDRPGQEQHFGEAPVSGNRFEPDEEPEEQHSDHDLDPKLAGLFGHGGQPADQTVDASSVTPQPATGDDHGFGAGALGGAAAVGAGAFGAAALQNHQEGQSFGAPQNFEPPHQEPQSNFGAPQPPEPGRFDQPNFGGSPNQPPAGQFPPFPGQQNPPQQPHTPQPPQVPQGNQPPQGIGQFQQPSDSQWAPQASADQPHEQPDEANDLIQASHCQMGHPNPPEAQRCRRCGQPLQGPPQLVRRPVMATLRPSTGEAIDVDRPVLIGRAPTANRVAREQLPKLLTVPSPSRDISRTHVQVSPEGWDLVVTDLNSFNGTALARPGQAPERLTPGEPVVVFPGCVLDLGDGVTILIDNPRQ